MTRAAAFSLTADGGVALGGELRVGDAAAFRVLCRDLARRAGDVRVDCAKTSFIDTAILQLLVALQRALQRRRHALVLLNVGDELATWLRCAGLTSLAVARAEAAGR